MAKNAIAKIIADADTFVFELPDIANEAEPSLTYEQAYDEVIASSLESVLNDGNVMDLLDIIETKDKSLWEKFRSFLEEIADLIHRTIQAFRGVHPESPEGRIVERMTEIHAQLQQAFAEGLHEAGENYRTGGQKNTADNRGVKHSVTENGKTGRINSLMSDSERTAILQRKLIVAPKYTGQADEIIKVEQENLEGSKETLIKAALVRIGEEFGAFTDYRIADINIEIEFSKSNLRESVSKEVSPSQIAKLLPILKDTVENAIGIECHSNRYYYDNNTVYFENLLGGYFEEDYFVPVRFGLKHSSTGKATLYVIVDQQKIDKKKIEAEVAKTTGTQNARSKVSRSASSVSLAGIIPFVNGKDLLRYIPDDMLNSEQRQKKWEAIAETIKRTSEKNDRKYSEFIAKGNLKAAQNMVNAAAKAAGYTIKAYHGTTNKEEHSVWNAERRVWDTTYTPITVFKKQYDEQAGHFFSSDMDNAGGYGSYLYSVFLMMKNPLVIECNGQNYSSVSYNGMEMDTYEWADNARKHRYDGVVFKNIRDGVDYNALSEPTTDYVVFESNRIKSADPITYDKNGSIIPLSERFNSTKRDIRYSARYQQNEAAAQHLQQENSRMTGEIASLTPLVQALRKMNGGKMRPAYLAEAVAHLKKIAGARGNSAELGALRTIKKYYHGFVYVFALS